jgi:hypothetical protein
MMKNKLFAEVAGWYGAIAIITAYLLVSFGLVTGEGYAFQILNITGAVGLIIIAIHKNVKQSVFLNIFWLIIGVAAIAKMYFG